MIPHGLKENVQALPSIDGVQKVVLQPMNHTIPNQEGKLRFQCIREVGLLQRCLKATSGDTC